MKREQKPVLGDRETNFPEYLKPSIDRINREYDEMVASRRSAFEQ